MEMSSVQVQEAGRRRYEPIPVEEKTEKTKELEVKTVKVFDSYIQCDRCKTKDREHPDAARLRTKRFYLKGELLRRDIPVRPGMPYLNCEFDLCTKCADELEKWLMDGLDLKPRKQEEKT